MGNMLYRKYRLYEDGMEIMIPSQLQLLTEPKHIEGQEIRMGDMWFSDYQWLSDDRRTVININNQEGAEASKDLLQRLQEYYDSFQNQAMEYECLQVTKRRMNGYDYGELQYRSEVAGYAFFTIFIIGVFEEREITLILQCMEYDRKKWLPVFRNISESLRILHKSKREGWKWS